MICCYVAKVFFPGLFFYVYKESHNLKKTQKDSHHNPKTPSTEILNPKHLIQDPNPTTTKD